MRLFPITIRRKRQIPDDEWSRIGQHEDQQQNGEDSADQPADQTDCRPEQDVPDCSSSRADFPGDFLSRRQGISNRRIIVSDRLNARANALPDLWRAMHQFLALSGQWTTRKYALSLRAATEIGEVV